MGHGGPPQPAKGFDLRLGEDNGLRVTCGDEPIEVCIGAAAPLLELFSGAPLGDAAQPESPPPSANP